MPAAISAYQLRRYLRSSRMPPHSRSAPVARRERRVDHPRPAGGRSGLRTDPDRVIAGGCLWGRAGGVFAAYKPGVVKTAVSGLCRGSR